MPPDKAQVDRWSGWSWRVLALAALYVFTGWLGLTLAHHQENATLLWPPTGLSLAWLAIGGFRYWPGVFVGAFVLNVAATPVGLFPASAIAVGNTLEAVVGTWLLRRWGFRFDLSRRRDVLVFLICGVAVCTTVSATIGLGTLWLADALVGVDPVDVWMIWWMGDAGGALVIAPLVWMLYTGVPSWGRLARMSEAWILAVCVPLVGWWAFCHEQSFDRARMFAFAPFPLVAWAGLRLRSRGAVLASVAFAILATVGTAMGRGPFGNADVASNVTLLWFYSVVVGCLALVLSAGISEFEALQASRLEVERGRRKLEERMHRQQRLESLGLLAGGVAHDFNNILTSIRANAELLDVVGRDDPDYAGMLAEIQTAADRAAEMCNRLLAYAGDRRPSIVPVDLAAVLDEVHALVKAGLSKSVLFELRVPSGMIVAGDDALLRQVFMNLILNGAEAIEGEEGTVRVEATRRTLKQADLAAMTSSGQAAPGEFAEVVVRDDGVGMEPQTVARMFDPFFSTKFTGRGLGLAAVLGIVEGHGGAIDASSDVGGGSEFRVFLPVTEAAPTKEPTPSTDEIRLGNGRLVLIADDERSVRLVTERILQSAGYEVLVAHDGLDAIARFRAAERVDLVLLDVAMPECDGLKALEEIWRIRPETPAVIMSGQEFHRDRVASLGAEFVSKPFASVVLLRVVARALAKGATSTRPVSGA